MECPRCHQEIVPLVVITEGKDEWEMSSPHYGKKICPYCNKWLAWVKKPKNQDKRTRTSKYTLDDLNIHYCEMCLRTPDMLGRYETLDLHHKMPIELGGIDEKSNILVVCTFCHKTIHARHTYLYNHFLPKTLTEKSNR